MKNVKRRLVEEFGAKFHTDNTLEEVWHLMNLVILDWSNSETCCLFFNNICQVCSSQTNLTIKNTCWFQWKFATWPWIWEYKVFRSQEHEYSNKNDIRLRVAPRVFWKLQNVSRSWNWVYHGFRGFQRASKTPKNDFYFFKVLGFLRRPLLP